MEASCITNYARLSPNCLANLFIRSVRFSYSTIVFVITFKDPAGFVPSPALLPAQILQPTHNPLCDFGINLLS